MATDNPAFTASIHASRAIFAVIDVPATVRFYRDILGFTGDWLWGDPPTFGGVSCAKVQVMFCQQPELAQKVEGHQHWFQCEDLTTLYEKHRSAGATILSPLENKPWGFSEYTVRDPNGYHLRFAGAAAYQRPKNARDSLPENVRIIERMPTLDEFMILTRAVGWNADADTAPKVLANSVFGVVAVQSIGDGEKAIGSIRVVGDGARFLYLQDVMVLPEFQNQRVGSAMMEVVMLWLQQNAPRGASVGLFTGKQAFYERFGFSGNGGGMTLFL